MASFYYSLDGVSWHQIGEPLQMLYTFTKHFMGYRYGLFNYATDQAGGYVEFDYFNIGRTYDKPFKLSGFDVDLPGRVQPIVTGPIQLNFVARRIVQNGLFPQITLLCGRLLKNDPLF